MIRIELAAHIEHAHDLKDFLDYVTEKMCGERADSHDTATLAYVVVRNIRDNITRRHAQLDPIEVWASNEGARAACRELSMFLGYASDQPKLKTFVARLLRDQYDKTIRRQDDEKWARERARIAKGRPTVREARRA